MTVVTTASAMAQARVEEFQQPYPAGQKNPQRLILRGMCGCLQ